MASEQQIQANRHNATKSTGPRTEEGKARVSQNALKHGLLAHVTVLPGEDPAEFDAQLAALEDAIQPQDALEHELVRQLADAQWRMRRLGRLESAFLLAALENRRKIEAGSRPRPSHYSDEENTVMLGRTMWQGCTVLAQLARYDAHLGRRFDRAIQQITRLREARGKRPATEGMQRIAPLSLPNRHQPPARNPISPQPQQALDRQPRLSNANCQTEPIASNQSGINNLAPEGRAPSQAAPSDHPQDPSQTTPAAVCNNPVAVNGHPANHPQTPIHSQN